MWAVSSSYELKDYRQQSRKTVQHIATAILSAVTASIFTLEKCNKSKDRRKPFLVNSLSLPFRTSFISEMKFGVETGKVKSYVEDIKKHSSKQISFASISHCFPKNRVREEMK